MEETRAHQKIDDISLKIALKQNMIGIPDLQDTQSLMNCLEECIRRYKRLETTTKTNQSHTRHEEEEEDLNCSIGAFIEKDEVEMQEDQYTLLATKIASYKSQRESLKADIQVLQGHTRKELFSSTHLLETDEKSQEAHLERLEKMSLKELVVFYQNLQSQLQEAQDKGMF